MAKEINAYSELKKENRNRIFNLIREQGSISRTNLSYELQLSLPTITQNLTDLLEEGLICESGSFGHTGGRRAKAFSLVANSKIAIGLDITRNHITTVLVNLNREIIYQKKERHAFVLNENYLKKLGDYVKEALVAKDINGDQVLGVGIAVPGLITEDHKQVFYGEILDITGLRCEIFEKYIPYQCRLFNDADAAGFAEDCFDKELTDAFYISLSNNIGGAVLINHKVHKGEGPRSGEIGHMTIYPEGKKCYCGQEGCFESYCNAANLSKLFDGNLESFFEALREKDRTCLKVWEEYLVNLSIAVHNVRMLFDCKVILGGYVGAFMDEYIDTLKELVVKRSPFENNAEFLKVCKVKNEALASGAALDFIEEFCTNI